MKTTRAACVFMPAAAVFVLGGCFNLYSTISPFSETTSSAARSESVPSASVAVSETSRPGVFTPSTDAASTAISSGLPAALQISWDSLVEPPQPKYQIVISLREDPFQTIEWALADAHQEVANGTLSSGESAEIEMDIDWSKRPYTASHKLLTFHACSSTGECSAQILTINFYRPPTAELTPTASCGYASFALLSSPELTLTYPESGIILDITNQGILQCGTLDWMIVPPSRQPPALSCTSTSGTIEGPQPGESASDQILCRLDWDLMADTHLQDLFLTLYAFPRVNGEDSADLISIHLSR
ncbi:MAG: hypothetical protein JXA25_12395 [Anaerolineales bacterium]|nr:hypothetical protein [Anaerolineales bacterium]